MTPDITLRPDGVFRGRCLPARWCTAQSNEGDWCIPARLHSALECVLNLYCLIYSYKIILNYLWYFVIICKEHTLQVTGRVTYRYSTTESLYLFTPSVRVPRVRLRFLPGYRAWPKIGQKGAWRRLEFRARKHSWVMPRHSPSTVLPLRPPQQRPSRNDRRGACQRSSQMLSRA